MRQEIQSAVDQVKSNPDKEDEAWAWFRIGAELQRIGRNIKSSKILGQEVKKTQLGTLPSSDRSDARWMFQNWKTVLEWLGTQTGSTPDDPFRMLADMNHSHPSAIRRQIRAWLQKPPTKAAVGEEMISAIQAVFEASWERSSSSILLSKPSIVEAEGIEYLAELEDPFFGITRGRYLFTWSAMADFIQDPSDPYWLHESVSEWIVEEGEPEGVGELMMDNAGRVHFRSDLES